MKKQLYIKNTRILMKKEGSLKYSLRYLVHTAASVATVSESIMYAEMIQCSREFSMYKCVGTLQVFL
jgi:hypothetical protein